MDLNIRGRKALITGADSGIGFATTQLLLAEGATVVMTDRDLDELDPAVKQLVNLDSDRDTARAILAETWPHSRADLVNRLLQVSACPRQLSALDNCLR